MELTGTTDLIQFNDSGSRVNSNLDVKNLRDDKFVTVSSDLSLHNIKYAFMSYAIFSQKSVLL